MPEFSYKAKKGPQDIVSGKISAASRDEAIQFIVRLGQTPLDVVEYTVQQDSNSPSFQFVPFWKKIHLKDVALFTRQVSDMLDAGVPILKGLDLMANRTKEKQLQSIASGLHGAIQDGDSFSAALQRYPEAFSSLYVHMVRAGELSGRLSEVMDRLAQFLEKEVYVRSEIRSSLMYPTFIFVLGVLSVLVLMMFVLPRLTVLFDDFDVALPFITVVVMNVSYAMARWWWLIFFMLASGLLYLYWWFMRSNGKKWFDQYLLRMPLVRHFIKQVELGRIARTMSTLLDGGVALVPAIEAASAVVHNHILADQMMLVAHNVKNGVNLSQAIEMTDFNNDLAITMIAVGEESGHLSKAFLKISHACERESGEWLKAFMTLLGPIVLVFVVGIVGVIIVSMLLPIFKMNLIIS